MLDPAQVAAALRPDTVLVSIMHVNNEIGVIQDIAAIAALCARSGSGAAARRCRAERRQVRVNFDELGIDLLSLSAHKAYGPKGVGALVVSRTAGRSAATAAIWRRPGAGSALRHGGDASGGRHGRGVRARKSGAPRGEIERIALLQARLWEGLSSLGGVLRNGDFERSVPHLLNVSFEGVEGESLLAAVRPHIAVSTGSACTSINQEPSYVLRALGRDDRLAESSLRFSFGRYSTEADVDTAVSVVTRAVERLRRIGGA